MLALSRLVRAGSAASVVLRVGSAGSCTYLFSMHRTVGILPRRFRSRSAADRAATYSEEELNQEAGRRLLRERLDRCCKYELLDEARGVVKAMRDRGFPIGSREYERLLYLCRIHRAVDLANEIVALVQSQDVPLSEAACSILISIHASHGNQEEAMAWFNRLDDFGLPRRMRSYSPAIQACAPQKTEMAYELLQRVLDDGFQPDEDSLVALLHASTHSPRTEIYEMGQRVLDAMHEYSIIPTRTTQEHIKAWFAADINHGSGDGKQWVVSNSYVSFSGVCSSCGTRLEPLELPRDRQVLLQKEVENLLLQSCTQHAFNKFRQFLKDRGPVDTVVDGLNVAHWHTPIANPMLVKRMIEYLESMGRNVLVFARSHCFSKERTQAKGEKVWHNLQKENKVWVVPTWGADDLFWLYTALVHGLNVDLITNDEMTDHKHKMHPSLNRDFERWRRGHQLRFEFSRFSPILQPKQWYDPVVQWSPHRSVCHVPSAESVEWLCISRQIPPPPPPSPP